MNDEVWVLGATGRTGRAVAPRLLVGSLGSNLARLAQDAPGVVVSTVGPFTTTASEVARACPPGTHYVDVANELPAVEGVLELDRQAAAAGLFVTGAGFGVLATESVLPRLGEGQPPATRVRVDAMASVAFEAGVAGSALSATIVEILSFGGRGVWHGRLVRSRSAAYHARLTTPDGDVLATGCGAVERSVLPAASAFFRIPGVSRFAVSRIARIPLCAQDMPRPFSWAYARTDWSDGTVREGWLQVGDGTDFTASVAAEVAQRLLGGDVRPGSHTPGALLGPGLAEAIGGEFITDQGVSPVKKG